MPGLPELDLGNGAAITAPCEGDRGHVRLLRGHASGDHSQTDLDAQTEPFLLHISCTDMCRPVMTGRHELSDYFRVHMFAGAQSDRGQRVATLLMWFKLFPHAFDYTFTFFLHAEAQRQGGQRVLTMLIPFRLLLCACF